MSSGCGDKKAGAQRRKGLGAAVRKYEEFRQNEVQRFDSLYSIKAASHSARRNQAVAELLSCLSLMRSLGDISRQQPVIEWSKAQVGAVTGSTDTPAAHCLPCQIWIDNQKPWDLLHSHLSTATGWQTCSGRMSLDMRRFFPWRSTRQTLFPRRIACAGRWWQRAST